MSNGTVSRNDKTLVAEFEHRWNKKRTDFPDGFDFLLYYKNIEQYFNTNVHPNVNQGAVLNGDGVLTDHGVKHVEMVMNRAYMIISKRIENISGFELFILLVAIHLHDVGNIYGRNDHEKQIMDVMLKYLEQHKMDMPLVKEIVKIAMAHSGDYKGSKDTIYLILEKESSILGKQIRPRLIGSLLRFADEISEDKTRATIFLLDSGELPKGNEIYHHYSMALDPISYIGSTLIFNYHLLPDDTKRKFGKMENNDVKRMYLYDEILIRMVKTLKELEYCRLYSWGFIDIDSISIKIDITKNEELAPVFEDNIRLHLQGYPLKRGVRIEDLVEKPLKVPNGIKLKSTILGGK